ncbi:PEP-CTERM sorting domain-containing protein [bacterium]|nr:PEP-CTERM sorting domain-containing protein [bacterium]
MKGKAPTMKTTRNLWTAAYLALLLALPGAQAQTIEAVASPFYNAPFRDSSGSLLNGAYVSVGSFGNRTASDVVSLFSGATTASAVGAVLTANYTSLLTPVAVNSSTFSIYNSDGYAPDNLLDFNNTPLYSVVAKQLGADLFEIGIFAAYDFTRSGSAGSYVYNRGSQINFANLNNELGVDTIRFRQAVPAAGGAGADALAGFGGASSTGFQLSSVTSTVVPEPSSASLMLLGSAGILALRRLRKNNV